MIAPTSLTAPPLYIFDLDGTLALTDHRHPLLENKDDPERWNRFYEACGRDEPSVPILHILETLKKSADIWIVTARSDQVKDLTYVWLCRHTSFTPRELDRALTMKRAGDWRPAEEFKHEFYQKMLDYDRNRLMAVFEDCGRVVDMWRKLGVVCIQVSEGHD